MNEEHTQGPLNQSPSIGELAKALATAQKTMRSASFDSVSKTKQYTIKYASLSAVIKAVAPLAENGIAFVQLPSSDGLVVTMTTRLIHTSGEWIECSMSADASNEYNKNVQGLGSLITYLKRYTLAAIAGIASDEDDDGVAAVDTDNSKKESPQAVAKPASKPVAKPKPKVNPLTARKATAMATIGAHIGEEGAKDTFDKFIAEHTVDGLPDYEAVCNALESEAKLIEGKYA